MKQILAAAITTCLIGPASLASADSNAPKSVTSVASTSILNKPKAGFYRLKIGAVSVLALSDGTLAFPADELLLNAEAGEIHRLLNDARSGEWKARGRV